MAAINPRCNYDVAGALDRQVREYDRRPPAENMQALSRRYSDLDSILRQVQVESDILRELCTASEFAGPNDQLAAVAAWSYSLEADIAAKRFAMLKCPATATTATEALLADAWYALATTFAAAGNGGAVPTPAPLVAEVSPKVRSRAEAVGFALPALADATQYWRDTVNAAVAPCPTQSPP